MHTLFMQNVEESFSYVQYDLCKMNALFLSEMQNKYILRKTCAKPEM